MIADLFRAVVLLAGFVVLLEPGVTPEALLLALILATLLFLPRLER